MESAPHTVNSEFVASFKVSTDILQWGTLLHPTFNTTVMMTYRGAAATVRPTNLVIADDAPYGTIAVETPNGGLIIALEVSAFPLINDNNNHRLVPTYTIYDGSGAVRTDDLESIFADGSAHTSGPSVVQTASALCLRTRRNLRI